MAKKWGGKASAKKFDPYAALTKDIVALMESDNSPWKRPWNVPAMSMPVNGVSGRPYSGGNVPLLLMAMASRMTENGIDNRFATYKQIEENGWKLGESAKPITVFGFKYREVPLKKSAEPSTVPGDSPEVSAEIPGSAGVSGTPPEKDESKIQVRKYPVFWLRTVYSFSDVEGAPPLEVAKKATSTAGVDLVQAKLVDDLIKKMGVSIEYRGSQAFYDVKNDRIQLPPKTSFETWERLAGTTFHEASHATGHPSRLGRFDLAKIVPFGSPDYAREELVADLGSIMARTVLNVPVDLQNNASYLKSWAGAMKENPKFLYSVLQDAKKVADLLIDLAEVPNPWKGLASKAEGAETVVGGVEMAEDLDDEESAIPVL